MQQQGHVAATQQMACSVGHCSWLHYGGHHHHHQPAVKCSRLSRLLTPARPAPRSQLHKVCDALAQQSKQRQGQLRYDYMVAVYAIMAGDNQAIERLSK